MPQNGETPTERIPDAEYRAYLDERQSLRAAEFEAAKSFDRWIITLSSGALGLSLVFVKDLVAPGPVSASWAFAISWVSLGLSVSTALASVAASQHAHGRFIVMLDDAAATRNDTVLDRARKTQSSSKWPKIIGWLNIAAAAFCIAGVLLLGFFVLKNLP